MVLLCFDLLFPVPWRLKNKNKWVCSHSVSHHQQQQQQQQYHQSQAMQMAAPPLGLTVAPTQQEHMQLAQVRSLVSSSKYACLYVLFCILLPAIGFNWKGLLFSTVRVQFNARRRLPSCCAASWNGCRRWLRSTRMLHTVRSRRRCPVQPAFHRFHPRRRNQQLRPI